MTLNGTSVPDERMTRKRALLAELELIRSQKAEVLRAIQQIAKKQKLGGVPSQAVALSHEAKMEAERRVHGDHQRKIWGLCNKILAELLKNSNTKLYFGEPVHRDKFPGYYEVIKEPRDLGSIKSQVESGFYPDIYALRDDVRLCFNNCRAYNPEGHPIRKIGDAASDSFEKKWVQKHVESEWEAEKQRHALAMERLEAEAKSLPEKIKEVDAELQELASKAAIRTTSQPPGPGREMTFEEKRRLSHLIGTLPGERLARVLEIIATAPTPPQGLQGEDDSEVELDIDAIDSDTLWKVQAYVEMSLNELDGKAARPGSAINAHVKMEQAQSEGQDGRSESDEVVGSKGNADSTGEHAPKKAPRTADLTTFVSATGPGAQPQFVKNNASEKKNIQLQNAGAWASLQQNGTLGGADGEGTEAAGAAALEDDTELWTEFQGREAQERAAEERKKALEREEAEHRKREEQAALEAAAKAAEEEAKRLAEEEEAAIREKEERRLREAAELEKFQSQGAAEAEVEALRQAGHGPQTDLTALGLAPRQDDDEDEDGGEMMEI